MPKTISPTAAVEVEDRAQPRVKAATALARASLKSSARKLISQGKPQAQPG